MSPSSVSAASDASITVANGTCDLPAAGLGKGSAQDPFIINSAKSLAEIADCRSRTFTVTDASVSGNQVTFTSNNALGVGHSVSITGVNPADFNGDAFRVVAATSTQFTVQLSETLSASYLNGGTVNVDMDFYEFRADIDLSVSVPDWNDLSAKGWVPVPETSHITIKGNSHTINGLTITDNNNDLGLFAGLFNANVQDLIFTNVNIDQSGSITKYNVGALFSYGAALNVRNVHVQDGSVIGSGGSVGLIGGATQRSNMADLSSSGVVGAGNTTITASNNWNQAPQYLGGLFGDFGGNLDNSFSTATVNGYVTEDGITVYGANVGGLVGYFYGNVSNSYATGNITGRERVGGLLGYYCCGDIYNVFATGNVNGVSNGSGNESGDLGGLVGKHEGYGKTSKAYATGNVTLTITDSGGQYARGIGGLMGAWDGRGETSDSYATGNVLVVAEVTSEPRDIRNVGGMYGHWCCDGSDHGNYATGSVTVINNSADGSVIDVGGYAGRIGAISGSGYGAAEGITASGDVSVTVKEGRNAKNIGGLFGFSARFMGYANVRAEGNVSVNFGYHVGGLVGYSEGNTRYVDSVATGNVSVGYDGAVRAGGFIGYAVENHHIERSSSTGSVVAVPITPITGSAREVGGFIGAVNGTLDLVDVYTRSNVTGSTAVGGLIGETNRWSTIRSNRVYVANSVVASGTNPVVDAVSNGSFVNALTTNVFDVTLAGELSNKANFIGKSTTDMKTQATFTAMGWSFDGDTPVWKISTTENGGYPTLVARSRNTPAAPAAPAEPTVVQVPAAAARCVVPKGLNVAFNNGSAKLTSKATRQIKSFVKRVKQSNCTTVSLQAYYVKNSPLARQRVQVLNTALKQEFWKRRYAVRLKSSTRAISGGTRERTVRLSVR